MTDIRELFGDYILTTDEESFHEGELRVSSLGVTTLLFDDGVTQLMLDGFVSRPSMFKVGFGRLSCDKKTVKRIVDDFDISRLQAIFVSHTHYDHVLDVPEFSVQTGASIYGSRSTLNVARGNGVGEAFLNEFESGKNYEIGSFRVKVIPSAHSKPSFFNNDLGREIKRPVKFPAAKGKLPEGGSYDFVVEHNGKKIVFKPSCGYVKGAYDGEAADVLFLATARFCQLTDAEKDEYFRETVGKLNPELVIPVHWDNFFLPVDEANGLFPRKLENSVMTINSFIKRTEQAGIEFKILPALKSIKL